MHSFQCYNSIVVIIFYFHRRVLAMADIITQARPDSFAVDILRDRRVKSSFETIEYYTVMDACVRNKDSKPYNTSPLLPKRGSLKAPVN